MVMAAFGHYRRRPAAALQLLKHPAAAWDRFKERMRDRRNSGAPPKEPYVPFEGWEAELHRRIGAPWPCTATQEFDVLWNSISERMSGRGFKLGPESYFGANDGDPEFVRAIWCLIRHAKPTKVVETGVAHGFTTRFILEALERNQGNGHLWSIDLLPLDPGTAKEVGVAVEGLFAKRWTLMDGSSRRLLPSLLSTLGGIDLFIHDSSHTERNVSFEMAQAARWLRPGGFMVIDDIDVNAAFSKFLEIGSTSHCLVCQSAPVRPDERRFDHKGLFGIVQSPEPSH